MGCCDTKKDPELFKSRSERACTDVLFLIAFVASWVGGICIAVASVNKDPSLLTDIRYPTDSYGNNCGNPGTATEAMGKVIYPYLDQDIMNQLDVFTTGQYWNFKPTKLCSESCPGRFDFRNPQSYGGVDYPCGNNLGDLGSGASLSDGQIACSNGTIPETYYTWVTQEVIDRCFPFDNGATVSTLQLCSTPACTAAGLNASLGDSVYCTAVDAYPADELYAWEVCGAGTDRTITYNGASKTVCEAQTEACNLVIKQERDDLFKPTTQTTESEYYTTQLSNYAKMVLGGIEGLLVDDAVTAQCVCGLAFPIILGFVWALFLWFFAAPLIYGLLLGLILMFVTGGFFFMYKAGWLGDLSTLVTVNNYTSALTQQAEEDEQFWYAILAVTSLVIGAILLIFFIMSRKAIKRLIAIVQECTKVFRDLAAIVIWPTIFQLPLNLGIFFYGFFFSYYIIMVWTDTTTMATLLALHVFLILWTLQFIKATTWSSMSAAVGVWFTTTNAAENEKKKGCAHCSLGMGELWNSTGLIFAKHIGSMAFGALVIAVCQFIRLVLATIDYYTKDLQDKNLWLKIVMKCSQCVMWCLQKTIEFISFFGFIFVAIKGDSFCRGCVNTFGFIMKNPAQTAVNKTVQSLLKILIGWSIPVTCSLMCFFWLDSLESYESYIAYWPALIVFIAAFIISDGICTVYTCIIDTIYIMAFEDMDRSGGPKYMSADLRKGFGIDEAENEASKSSQKYQSVTQRRKEAKEGGGATYTATSGGGGGTSQA